MRLVCAARGPGRIPAIEVVVTTGLTRLHHQRREVLNDPGSDRYWHSMGCRLDQSLFNLLQAGLLAMEEAIRSATHVDEFRMSISGISESDEAVEGTHGMPQIQPPTLCPSTNAR